VERPLQVQRDTSRGSQGLAAPSSGEVPGLSSCCSTASASSRATNGTSTAPVVSDRRGLMTLPTAHQPVRPLHGKSGGPRC
jgi:hypothetical protein